MITDRDIAIAAATKGRRAREIPVRDVISGTVYSCVENDDIHLQGILCLNDIALRAEEAHGRHVPELSYEDAMSTFKAVCEHRAATVAAHA